MPDTKWLDALRNSLGGGREVALLLVDVDQIHSYVFESAKLPEMRGASLILDLLNVGGLEEARDVTIQVDGKIVRGIGDVIKDWGLDPEVNVIYSGGGGALLALPPDKADGIQAEIEELYLATTLTATVTTVKKVVTLDELENGFPHPAPEWFERLPAAGPLAKQLVGSIGQLPDGRAGAQDEDHRPVGGFGQILAALIYEARKKKDAKPTVPLFEVSPFTERCAFCHYRPAFTLAQEVDERPICLACHRKREAGDKQSGHGHYIKSFRKYLYSNARDAGYSAAVESLAERARLKGDPWDVLKSPPDLEAIGEYSRGKASNYLGIIYADGNEMGAAIESVGSADQLRFLSDAIRQSIKAAVFSGLARYISGPRTANRDKRRGKGVVRSVPIHYHPFEIVSIGGDDVYLFVPSDIVLELASHVCAEFSSEFRRRTDQVPELGIRDMSLSAGVLIAQVTSPVYFTRRIVEGLLKSAKTKTKAGGAVRPAIDFQVITTDTAISEDIQAFRDVAYANRYAGERLTTRPLYLDELDELIQTVKDLKSKGFPPSQLYQLREAVVLGPQPRASNFYNYQRSRNPKLREAYAPLHQMLFRRHHSEEYLPLWNEGSHRVTPIPDIVEVYNFVSEPEKRGDE